MDNQELETVRGLIKAEKKSEAIAFAEWAVNEGWEWSTSQKFNTGQIRWYKVENFSTPEDYLTTEQLYSLYLESKK